MVMENPDKFNKLQNLSTDTHFINTLRLSDKNFEERYDLELVTRFVCLRTEDIANLKG